MKNPQDHPKALKPSHRFFFLQEQFSDGVGYSWIDSIKADVPKTWAFNRDPYPYHVWQYGIFTYMKMIENP